MALARGHAASPTQSRQITLILALPRDQLLAPPQVWPLNPEPSGATSLSIKKAATTEWYIDPRGTEGRVQWNLFWDLTLKLSLWPKRHIYIFFFYHSPNVVPSILPIVHDFVNQLASNALSCRGNWLTIYYLIDPLVTFCSYVLALSTFKHLEN